MHRAVPPETSAKVAGLCYVGDDGRGFSRKRAGAAFAYFDDLGKRIRDARVVDRIRRLAIPPAWTDVWISPIPDGHIQATGRDLRGRKQYRYHPRWREVRDETKFHRTLELALVLPKVRSSTEVHLGEPGLSRDKVIATVVRLLEVTLIRVGNEEYAHQNRSYGLTTLEGRHVDVHGATVSFKFRGKSGKDHAISIQDKRLARVVARCSDLPGHELFQFLSADGSPQKIHSHDVNDYLRAVTRADFTAKDLRTWAGTVLAASELRKLGPGETQAETRRNVALAIERVARRLGNTKTVCKKSYVHPDIVAAYLEGTVIDAAPAVGASASPSASLTPEEAAVVRLLRARDARAREPLTKTLGKSVRLAKRARRAAA